jgi:hypothetical protein
VVFFNLLYSDRRAHIHIFVDSPVTEVYNLVNTDMWSQFTVHRMAETNISADLISAVLSQGLVSLNQVLTVHHECTDGGPSLIGLLSNLPTSTASLRTECNGGNFTVISAWPDFDTALIQHKFNPDCANEGAIQDLLAHHDKLRIAQIAKLIELALDDGSDDEQFHQLQEVCSLIFPDLPSERPDDEGEQHNLLSTRCQRQEEGCDDTNQAQRGNFCRCSSFESNFEFRQTQTAGHASCLGTGATRSVWSSWSHQTLCSFEIVWLAQQIPPST